MRLFGYHLLCEHIPEGMEPGADGRPTKPKLVWESWDNHLEDTSSRVPPDEERLINESVATYTQSIKFILSRELVDQIMYLAAGDVAFANDLVEHHLRIALNMSPLP